MSDWVDIGSADELESTSRLEGDVDGFRVRVARVSGTLYAFEDRCTHDDSPFDDAPIEGCEIICPRHGARFSLQSGEALSPPAYEPLRIFAAREVAGRIQVRA
ncbi:MAG TPA: non-heme iron oxygenase ferredoxin subunit [Steroidobacteraceae bacterium]|nr:non-heme iron oxygenase ferredoxin subunit [Steroidobacteraceae bacterium]